MVFTITLFHVTKLKHVKYYFNLRSNILMSNERKTWKHKYQAIIEPQPKLTATNTISRLQNQSPGQFCGGNVSLLKCMLQVLICNCAGTVGVYWHKCFVKYYPSELCLLSSKSDCLRAWTLNIDINLLHCCFHEYSEDKLKHVFYGFSLTFHNHISCITQAVKPVMN